MLLRYLVFLCLITLSAVAGDSATTVSPATSPAPADATDEEPPEGYYAFVESPNATPPRVRPPPYRQVATECEEAADARPHVTANNLCGDLNRGTIPRNPMGHSLNGEPYPFELIRKHTLRFLSRTLPVLRADSTLPRVTRMTETDFHDGSNTVSGRSSRSLKASVSALPAEHRGADMELSPSEAPRESRKFCDGGGVFCMLYRAINGEPSTPGVERREDPGHPPAPHAPRPPPAAQPPPHTKYEGPPTPCPARVEYATPVFARNYQGVWRYVVQIPYEGYFTQTIEVTRCMQARCHYLDGGCLSSPRWVSLLVAELHYPRGSQSPSSQSQPSAAAAAAGPGPGPDTTPAARPDDFQEYQQYLQRRAGSPPAAAAAAEPAPHCDGHDELGCYQVRLYYDWFLVPGSCKCWRPDYFARYVRRRHNNEL